MSELINKIKAALQDRYGDMGVEDQEVIDFFEAQLKLAKFGALYLKATDYSRVGFNNEVCQGAALRAGILVHSGNISPTVIAPGIKEAAEELTRD